MKQDDSPEEIVIVDDLQDLDEPNRVTPIRRTSVDAHHAHEIGTHQEVPFCICGNTIVADAKHCRRCGRKVADLARERYVMKKTEKQMESREAQLEGGQVMQGARSEEIELPPSPTGLPVNFFSMLNATSVAVEQERGMSSENDSPSKKSNTKFFGAHRDRKPLRHEANNLRLAMGGTLNKSVKAVGGASERSIGKVNTLSDKVIGKVNTLYCSPGSTRATASTENEDFMSRRISMEHQNFHSSNSDEDLSDGGSPNKTKGSSSGSPLRAVGQVTPIGHAATGHSGGSVSESESSNDSDVECIEVSSSSSSSEEEGPSPQRGNGRV